MSAVLPGLKVEVCFTNPLAQPTARTWVDITPYVLLDDQHPVTITRGRSTALDVTQPGRLTLTLDNSDGRFTPGRAASPYYPNVKINRAIRVTATLGSTGEPPALSLVFSTYEAVGLTYDGVGWTYEQTGAVGAASTYPLFMGFIDTWPTTWENGFSEVCHIEATDWFKLLSRRQLRSMYEDYILTSKPKHYYPLSDQGTGLTVGNAASPIGKPPGLLRLDPVTPDTTYPDPLGTDGPYRDATQALDLNSDLASDATHGFYLDLWASGSGPSIPWLNGSGGGTLEFWFKSSSVLNRSPGTWPLVSQVANFAAAPQHRSHFDLGVVGHGSYSRLAIWNSHTAVVELDGFGEVSDDRWHFLQLLLIPSSSTIVSYRIWYDLKPSFSSVLVRMDDPAVGLRFGDDMNSLGAASNKFHGHLSGVAFYVPPLPETFPDGFSVASNRYYSGLYGWEASAPFWRIVTLLVNSMPTVPVLGDLGNNPLAAQATAGVSVLDAIQEVMNTEAGTVHIDGQGALVIQDRHHQRYRLPDLAVDVATDGIGADFTVGVEDQNVLNLLTVSRRGGASVTVADATSQADYGQASDSATTLHMSDEDMADWANHRVATYAQPRTLAPRLTINPLTSPSLWAVSLAVDMGHLVRVANLPTVAPSTTTDLVVESVRHDFTINSWTTTLETSPADTRAVAVFGVSTFGHCVFGF